MPILPAPVIPAPEEIFGSENAPPPPAVEEENKPRTEKPMEDYTGHFDRKEFTLNDGKEARELVYFLKEPQKSFLEFRKKFPLVLVLHDTNGKAPAASHLIFKEMPKNYPAFIVVPVLPKGMTWAVPVRKHPSTFVFAYLKQHLNDAVELVAQLSKDYPVDKRRIYVVGCGEGGYGAFGAALKYSDIFAAAAPINGGWAQADAPLMTKMPLFVLHSKKNRSFLPRISRNLSFYIQQFGGNISYIEVPDDDHDCDDDRFYTPALWEWMFSQHR